MKKKSNIARIPALDKPIKVKRKSSDAQEESTVHKALQNIKKVLEKKEATPKKEEKEVPTKVVSAPAKVISQQYKKDVRHKRISKTRGLVYVGHIPHGFYEDEMRDYFQQFGPVTRVRVARSRNTGRSRGYGYVEFIHHDVAKVAAETMNNYLMCGRLLKATYVSPDKQHERFFAGKAWSKDEYPKLKNRKKITRERNMKITNRHHETYVQRKMQKISGLEKKLKESGIELKFKPVNLSRKS